MTADAVFMGGPVHTPPGTSPASAVAITGETISLVGTEEAAAAHIGRHTAVIDLAGRSLLPGFQDAHVHPCTSGVEMSRCDLLALSSAAEYLEAIAAYAAANPAEAWGRGKGWAKHAFPGGTPTAGMLDSVVPDRPAVFVNRDDHGAWVNTKALDIAGITAATPDPVDGRIERNSDGTPFGTLQEGAATLVLRHAPPTQPDEIETGILAAERYLFSLGVTGWQDAWVEPEQHAAYVSLAGRGDLTASVVGALWWDRHRGLEQIEELEARRAEAPAGRYRATTIKIMQDGVCENFTAALRNPYCGDDGKPTDNSGLSFIDPAQLAEIAIRLDSRGFQIHFHALGDRAVTESLDALEAAHRANGSTSGRHHLAHLQLVHQSDLPRFASLNATANAQTLWAHHDGYQDDLTIPFLGPERASRQYPWRSLVDSGARLALGSDWDVSTPNPFEILHVALHRAHPDSRDRPPFFPEERINLNEALDAYTRGSSYVNHRDDSGTIEPGKAADLVVADQPINQVDLELASVTADLTMVAGQVVYERNGQGG